DPGVTVARQAADELRWADVCTVEIGARRAMAAVVNRAGTMIARRLVQAAVDDSASVEVVAHACRAVLAQARAKYLPLICFGGRGPAVAASLASACGSTTVLIPALADSMAAVGMLISDRVLQFREESPSKPLDL